MTSLLGAVIRSRKSSAKEVLINERFQKQLALLAQRLQRPLTEIRDEVAENLQEIVTVQNPLFTMMFDHLLGPMHTRAWTIEVDKPALINLRRLNKTRPLLFLPTHRSYADAFILTRALRDAGLPRNHILGGNNLGFFPLGTIIRRSGGVLVRRNFYDDEVYKFVVREYLGHLVAQGRNLEWYMEGGRSRTGKLRPPKYGLLRYLVDAIENGVAEDMLLVPVSMTYDQLHEVGVLVAEEAGMRKAKEGLRWLTSYARMQQRWVGTAFVGFGEPLSLKQALSNADGDHGGRRWTVEKIAFEVFQRINRATPVTAPALVTLALLGVGSRSLTLGEVSQVVGPLIEYSVQRNLPSRQLSGLRNNEELARVLETLTTSGVVLHFTNGIEPVYGINPGQHSVAAFYRNSAIHWFVNRAITELAWFTVLDSDAVDPVSVSWQHAFELRDLLKFDFFFSNRELFSEEIKAEMALLDPGFKSHAADPDSRHQTFLQAPFVIAHRVLPAFLEAYFVVADRLAAHPVDVSIDKAAFINDCCNVGKQYLLQQRLHNPECVSKELFGNALLLAANRDLLKPGGEALVTRRQTFANELATLVTAVGAIDALDQVRLRREWGAGMNPEFSLFTASLNDIRRRPEDPKPRNIA
jgi:glycerol-3-phosphate O-acyltransferase